MSTVDTFGSRSLANAAARAAADKKARDILVLDLGDLLAITDFFVLASASTQRQLGTVADEIVARLKAQGRMPVRREGEARTGWVLLDYGEIVVHVFTSEQRAFYSLERLWADAPAVTVDGAGEPVAVGQRH
ncbi:MAG: ribosome silencing factor [Actinobacteria bacterium]|nr:ribosome silencing factor [Actinomycetota bacterium]